MSRRKARPGLRAVQYLRMSTPRQPGSLAQQASLIAAYAELKGYVIVRTYEDAAVSGVDTRKRPAFRDLLATVLGGKADFEAILVHDVSRWGRFPDPDEAAHYEFLCGQEGVRIEYCAETFGDGRNPSDSLMKALKRAMAAEYSRELSAKVRSAQRHYASQGYWMHGTPGYGLARQSVPDKGPGRPLFRGDYNADRKGRTQLAPGDPAQVETIRRMFKMCGEQGRTTGQIARALNDATIPSPSGARWSAERVRAILTNPKYAGELVTWRRTTPLGGTRKTAPNEDWICAPGAAPALVERGLFEEVQARLARPPPPCDEQLLAALRPIGEQHGVVSEARLKALGVAFHRSYRARFGSLQAAFALIGHAPATRFPKKMGEADLLRGLARLYLEKGDLSSSLVDADPRLPSADHCRIRFGSMANAYARIGFVRIGEQEAASAMGRARLQAREAQVRAWAQAPKS